MKYFFLYSLLACQMVASQKTLQLKEGATSPKSALKDVAWISGHWQGEAFGGIAEEIWSPPMGGSMLFVFRLVNDDKVTFYEIGHIKESDATLVLQLKHFDGSLKSWEEKDETVDFKLVKIEKDKVFFEGLTIEKTSDTQMNVYVLVKEGNKENESLFAYHRIE